MQPKLCTEPRLIGDASKNDVFVEGQFGNSATLYRDYYKFHYGLMHGLLSLTVLIVPTTPTAFFPTRPTASPTWLSTISPAAATRFCRSRFRYW
jgi:hypothetical protein